MIQQPFGSTRYAIWYSEHVQLYHHFSFNSLLWLFFSFYWFPILNYSTFYRGLVRRSSTWLHNALPGGWCKTIHTIPIFVSIFFFLIIALILRRIRFNNILERKRNDISLNRLRQIIIRLNFFACKTSLNTGGSIIYFNIFYFIHISI